jgi:hypothetical protein
VELTDDVRARLVVARSARVLQHAPDLSSGVRAQRVVIESAVVSRSAAASAAACSAAARSGPRPGRTAAGCSPPRSPRIRWPTGRRPTCSPRSTCPDRGRRALAAGPARAAGRPSGGGPALPGRPGRVAAPARPAARTAARVDVRLLDADGTAGRSFGRPARPATWLVYGPGRGEPALVPLTRSTSTCTCPGRRRPADPEPDLLRRLAAGCVVLLPTGTRPTFGGRRRLLRGGRGARRPCGLLHEDKPVAAGPGGARPPSSSAATTATSCTPSAPPGLATASAPGARA